MRHPLAGFRTKEDFDMSDIEAKIREKARELWLAEGQPEGRADQHWLEAEAIVRAEAEAAAKPKAARKPRAAAAKKDWDQANLWSEQIWQYQVKAADIGLRAKTYLEQNRFEADWSAIERASSESLVNALSIMAPYGSEEKQALLEAPDLRTRSEVLVALAEMEIAASGGSGGTIQ